MTITSVRASQGATDQWPVGQARWVCLMWAVRRTLTRLGLGNARRQSGVGMVGSGSSKRSRSSAIKKLTGLYPCWTARPQGLPSSRVNRQGLGS